MRSIFPIAILNGTSFFFTKQDDPCLGQKFACQKTKTNYDDNNHLLKANYDTRNDLKYFMHWQYF